MQSFGAVSKPEVCSAVSSLRLFAMILEWPASCPLYHLTARSSTRAQSKRRRIFQSSSADKEYTMQFHEGRSHGVHERRSLHTTVRRLHRAKEFEPSCRTGDLGQRTEGQSIHRKEKQANEGQSVNVYIKLFAWIIRRKK